jgi:hypothetical protein
MLDYFENRRSNSSRAPESVHKKPRPIHRASAAEANVGQTWRNGGQSLGRSQQPQFLRPVHQRPAQSLHVWMPTAKLGLRVRDLLAAARDSCCPTPAFLGDLLERPPVALQLGLFARQRLPALHDYVHVLRIQLDAAADALGELCRGTARTPTRHVSYGSGSGAASDRRASGLGGRTSPRRSRP